MKTYVAKKVGPNSYNAENDTAKAKRQLIMFAIAIIIWSLITITGYALSAYAMIATFGWLSTMAWWCASVAAYCACWYFKPEGLE